MEIGVHGETSGSFFSLARRTDIRSDTDSDSDMDMGVRNPGPGSNINYTTS